MWCHGKLLKTEPYKQWTLPDLKKVFLLALHAPVPIRYRPCNWPFRLFSKSCINKFQSVKQPYTKAKNDNKIPP